MFACGVRQHKGAQSGQLCKKKTIEAPAIIEFKFFLFFFLAFAALFTAISKDIHFTAFFVGFSLSVQVIYYVYREGFAYSKDFRLKNNEQLHGKIYHTVVIGTVKL